MYALTFTFAAALLGAEPHSTTNPVFGQLVGEGVYEGVALPQPSLADGTKADAQQKLLKEIVGRAFPLERFQVDSPVAPQIIRMEDVDNDDPELQLRRVDAWFVAYGKLDAIAEKDFLDGLISGDSSESEGQAEGKTLTAADLAKRGIKIAPEAEKYEAYAHGTFELLSKVKLTGTVHSCWSRTDDSIVAASILDPRFTGDAEFPNQWQPLERMRDGTMRLGDAKPYRGAGEYIKITQLAAPKDALLIEFHLVYSEPKGWFGGTNMLTSKLPVVVQNQIRNMRRELAKVR
jgi:hypothetical protein